MSTTSLFNVPTAVLLDQAAFTLDELRAEASAPTREALAASGFDPAAYAAKLADALERGRTLEADQERAKANLGQEREEDRAHAERGYRWIRRLHARLRLAEARGDAPGGNLGRRFRFGALPSVRVRGVLYELRILVPELAGLGGVLADHGLDAAFLEEGRSILADLDTDRAETAAATSALNHLTQQVRAVEAELTALIRELRAAREIATLDTGRELPGFSLQILRAWVGKSSGLVDDEPPAGAEDPDGEDTVG